MYLEYYHSPIFILFSPWHRYPPLPSSPPDRWIFRGRICRKFDGTDLTEPFSLQKLEFAEMLPLTHSPLVSFYTTSLYRLITGETSSAPWPSPAPFSSCKTLQPLITFISRNGPLTPLQQANKERERKIFSVRREKREGKNLDKNWIDIHNYLINIFFF